MQGEGWGEGRSAGATQTVCSPVAPDGIHSLPDLPVLVIRRGPWTVVLSAYTRPEAPGNRWVIDFQSHLSIFHERAGLIIGGGGGKRQAAFSLFTESSRPLGLPSLAIGGTVETLSPTSALLSLRYEGFTAHLQVFVSELDVRLTASASGTGGVHLQLQFPLKGDAPITTASARTWPADVQEEILPEQLGNRLGRQGLFTITGFEGARALLFILPYNTHWKNGWSPDERAVGVVAQPLANNSPRELHIHAR